MSSDRGAIAPRGPCVELYSYFILYSLQRYNTALYTIQLYIAINVQFTVLCIRRFILYNL